MKESLRDGRPSRQASSAAHNNNNNNSTIAYTRTPDAYRSSNNSKSMGGFMTTSDLRDHLVAATGEFVGTTLFLFYAFAWHQTVAMQAIPATATNGMMTAESVFYISFGYGFSLLVTAWAFYRISGGLFNPAVRFSFLLFCTPRIPTHNPNRSSSAWS